MSAPSCRHLVNAGFYILIGFVLSYMYQVQDSMTLNKGRGGAKVDGTSSIGVRSSTLRGSEDDVYYQDKDDAAPVGLCERLQGKSAPWLWTSSKSHLLQASLLQPFDPNGYHKEWMVALLQQLSTSDLQKGLLHPPSAHDFHRVMQKIEARMLAMKTSSAASAPIVQIGVFGGSVTIGNGCPVLPDELKPFFQEKMGEAPPDNVRAIDCAWPTRLQLLCDYFLGKDVVRLTNLGVGGSRSTMSMQLLKYRLFGNGNDEYDPTKHGFDVIINGHGVNDNNFEAQSRTQVELGNFNEAIQVAEAFYRQARTSRPCADIDDDPPPLVLFLNEYLGNFNELIVGENLRHAAVHVVSEYYDFAYVSYSNVFARFVQRRSNETLFSPHWGTIQQPKFEVHFGMTGHVLISWVLAYSALQSVVDYCNHQQQHPLLGEEKEWNLLLDEQYTNQPTSGRHDVRLVPDASKDEVLINSLPPLLDTAKWTTISETWQHDAVEYKRQVHEYCALGDNITQSPCPFAFLSSSLRSVFTAADDLNKQLAPFIVTKAAASKNATTPAAAAGWQAFNDMRGKEGVRVGLVPMHGVGSKITFRVNNLSAPVRLVTIHSMKSYGPEWDASIAHFQLRVLLDHANSGSTAVATTTKLLYETSFNLEGWHDQKTSIGYAHEIYLGGANNTPAQVGTNMELEITLVKGIKFKIMAIMMCVR